MTSGSGRCLRACPQRCDVHLYLRAQHQAPENCLRRAPPAEVRLELLHGLQSADHIRPRCPQRRKALFQLPADCPAVAAHITCNADLGIAEVAYHPLWLERSQSQASMQPQM